MPPSPQSRFEPNCTDSDIGIKASIAIYLKRIVDRLDQLNPTEITGPNKIFWSKKTYPEKE